MIDQVLSLLEESLMLCLEHLELLEGVIADFFELLLVLLINLLLDVLPVIVGELLIIVEWVERSHLVREAGCCLLCLDRIGSLVNALACWHGSDSWRGIRLLHSLAGLLVVSLDYFWLHVVLLGESVTSDHWCWLPEVLLLSSDGAFVEIGAISDIGLGWLDIIIVSLLWWLV